MNIEKEFGGRLVTLHDGRRGLRSDLSIVRGQSETVNGRKVYYFRASDATIDRYNEVIEPAGWDVAEYRKNNVVVDSHRYDSIQWLIGNAVDVQVTPQALVLGIVFSQANPLGRLAEGMVEEDALKSGSVGFIPLDWKNGQGKEPARRYTRQSLLEFSLTAIPANPNALKLALNSGRVDQADIEAAIECLSIVSEKASNMDHAHSAEPHSLTRTLTHSLQFFNETVGLDAGAPHFCNTQAATGTDTRALGSGGNEAQWLQLARSLREVMK